MDEIEEWAAAQQRVLDLVEPLSPEQAEERVPACPDWSVRDLLAHMVGLTADVVAGDEPADHHPAWTARQVAARRDRDVAALAAEWRELAGPLRDWMRRYNTRPLGDVVIHEHDLRGALGVPGARDTPGTAAIRTRFTGRFTAKLRELGDLPPIALVGERWSWASAGAPDDAAVVLRAPDFDLARALVTRRSAAQLRGWTERGDVEPYLPAFALLGPLPVEDLTDG